MSPRADKRPRFQLSYLPDVAADLAEPARFDPDLLTAVTTAINGLAFGRQRGKLLDERHVTGDLTGLLRLRVDLPAVRPTRYRIVYRLLEQDTVIEVLAIGERADHAVYRDVLSRLNDRAQGAEDEP